MLRDGVTILCVCTAQLQPHRPMPAVCPPSDLDLLAALDDDDFIEALVDDAEDDLYTDLGGEG